MSRGRTYPPDEFDVDVLADDVPHGVHRAPRSALARWWPLLVALVLCPLLAFGFVSWLNSWEGRPDVEIPILADDEPADETPTPTPTGTDEADDETGTTPTPTSTPTATLPEPDLDRTVEVYNSTLTSGLAGNAAGVLEDAGFSQVAALNWQTDPPSTTTVFYPDEDDAGTAQEVADALGIETVEESADVGDAVVVVLTDDFEPL